jgi:hypothetical protein
MSPPPDQTAILLPLVTGVGLTFCTIVIHGIAVVAIVHFVLRQRRFGHAGVRLWRDMAIVVEVSMMALAAHLIEMTLWAAAFFLLGELPDFPGAFVYSAQSYTSLGGGGVILTASWRLLEPLETADGLLMFGITTAIVFAIVQRLVEVRFGLSDHPGSAAKASTAG